MTFELGRTTDYGTTSAPITLEHDDGAVSLDATLTSLTPATTYHVRIRASNAVGTVVSGDLVFTTPAEGVAVAPANGGPGTTARLPALAVRTTFSWDLTGAATRVKALRLSGLVGGETAKVTCTGGGCPYGSRTFRRLQRGTRLLPFDPTAGLRRGATVEVRVTAPGTTGRVTLARVGRPATTPAIARSCLLAGTLTPTRC